MLRVTINGQVCEVPAGTMILDAVRAQGESVPILCHDERLHPSGACRLCIVEVKGRDRFPTACNTPAADGMQITAATDKDRAAAAALAKTTADEWAKSRGPEAVDSLAKARALLGR